MRGLALALTLTACGPGEGVGPIGGGRETPLPVSGGTMLALADGRVVAADPDGDRLAVANVSGGALEVGLVALPVGARPGRMVEEGDALWVVAQGLSAVLEVDLATGLASTHPVCREPRGIDAADGRVWVACAEGELVGLEAGQVVARWALEPDLRDVVAVDGELWVTVFRTAELLKVADGVVRERLAPPVRADQHPAAAFEPSVAWRLVRDPAGGALMAHQRAQPDVVDLEGGFGLPAYGGASCDAVVQTGLTRFPIAGAPETIGPLLKSVLPVDVVAREDGGAWLVAAGADGISDVAVADVSAARFGDLDGCDMLPGVPWSAATGGDGGRVVAAAEVAGGLLVQTQAPFSVGWAPGSSVSVREVFDEGLEARGHEVFHAAVTGTVACASCHPEGGEDGRVWRFDEGEGEVPRRTQSLAGGLGAGTAPLHWLGEHPDLASLLADSFVARIGGVVREGDDVAVERFLGEIPERVPRPPDALSERGAAVFAASGCDACHVGAWLTDGESHDVGTTDGGATRPFQTPSLLGVGARGPWMHDGCADTLEARFDPACGGAAHGDTVLAEDVAALVAWLQTR